MRILITGGAGFIASQIADAYLAVGHEVAVLDDLSNGLRRQVPAQAQFFEGSIADAEFVSRVCGEFKPQVVSHHAAQMDVRRSVEDPAYDAGINVLGGLNVLLSAAQNGAERFFFASSGGAIYGTPESIPVAEGALEKPESPYGLTKATFEGYLRLWHDLHGLTTVSLRYANVYGPRQGAGGEAGVVSVFSTRLLEGKPCTIYGDGTSARDYVYVGDVVEANLLALTKGDNQSLNIGTGHLTTLSEVYEALSAATGTSQTPGYAPTRPGEVYRSSLDATRARDILGWTPQVQFREGIGRTVEWLKGDLAKRTSE